MEEHGVVASSATSRTTSRCGGALLLRFELLDILSQPTRKRRFDFARRTRPVKRLQRLPLRIQRNLPAWEPVFLIFRWNEPNQWALRAQNGMRGIVEIHTRG